MNDADFLAACHSLAPLLAAGADDGERLRRVPDTVMAAVHDADVLRAVVPRLTSGAVVVLRHGRPPH